MIMELNGRNARDIFAKNKSVDLTDVTIINTPKPQASSTVDKKHRYEGTIIGVKNCSRLIMLDFCQLSKT